MVASRGERETEMREELSSREQKENHREKKVGSGGRKEGRKEGREIIRKEEGKERGGKGRRGEKMEWRRGEG